MSGAPVMLIAGANGGLGRELAERARAAGWRVFGVSRSEGADAQADVSIPEGADAAIAACTEAMGVPDAMVNARVIVDVLAFACQVQAVKRNFGAGICNIDRNIVADQPATQVETGGVEARILANQDVCAARLQVIARSILDSYMARRRRVTDDYRNNRIGVLIRRHQAAPLRRCAAVGFHRTGIAGDQQRREDQHHCRSPTAATLVTICYQ